MTEHRFHFHAPWSGGRNGVGTIACGQLQTEVSIATGMGGPGLGTNPDEMLLGAAATCYLMTLAAMLERARLPVVALALDSDMLVEVVRGAYVCRRITHCPTVTLSASASGEDTRAVARIVTMAERHCMVSNALRGNVEINVEPCVKLLD